MKCLIIEDDLISREIITTMLSDLGDCVPVGDGDKAIKVFGDALDKGEPYDLICLDIVMPGINGQETLKEIRRIEKQRGIGEQDGVKVVMVTALSDPDSIMSAFRTGCEAYVVKPVKKEELLEEIQKLGLTQLETD